MPASLYRTATEYVANELTITRGTADDITSVGVFHSLDPAVVPTVAQFTTVQLIKPPHALAEGTKIDVISLIGTKGAAHLALPPGDYQRWVLVVTAAEDKIRRVDVLSVL